MGTRGPIARTPAATRRLGNPGKRPLPDVRETYAPEPLPTTPPDELGPDGSMLWVHIAGLPWVSSSDAALLVRMCRLADLIATLDDSILTAGVTYESRGRVYAHPSLSHRAECERRMASYMAAFGLSPADRMRLGIAEVKAQSKFDELLARREARNA